VKGAIAMLMVASALACALACVPSLRAQSVSGEELAQQQPALVRFRGAAVLEVRAALGDLQAPERARAIEQRIALIAAGSADALDEMHVVERERTSDVVVGDKLVVSVTDADAAPLGRTRQQLAADVVVRLHMALASEFSGRSIRGILVALGLTVVATAVLLIFWRLVSIIARRTETMVHGWEGTRLRAVRVRGAELISAASVTAVAAQIVRILRWILLAIGAIVYGESVLSWFPWTRGAALEFRAFVGNALTTTLGAIGSYLPNLLYIALIVLVVRLVMRGATLIFDAIESGTLHFGHFRPEWARPTEKIARFLIIAFAAVIIFPYLPGAGSPAFQGVSIFFGVLLSLGSSSAVANVVAGIVMTYMTPFRLGDRVKVGDTVGDVVETNLLVVRIRTIKNVDITIPNAGVLGSHIENYSARAREGGVILHTTVTIGYDVPWRTVHALLTRAAGETDGILGTPAPFVLQTSLDDFYVSYQLNAYSDQPNRMAVIYGELHQRIQDAFAEAGVEIMSPHYRAVRDGNTVTLPADHLPASYVAPPFRVATVADPSGQTMEG